MISENEIRRILLALASYDVGEYDQAAAKWESLSADSDIAEEHFFWNLVLTDESVLAGIPVDSPEIALKLVRVLEWRKAWEAALSFLQKYQSEYQLTSDLEQEVILIQLNLGRYNEAVTLLERLRGLIDEESDMTSIVRCWLATLLESQGELTACLAEIEATHLYIPVSTLGASWETGASAALKASAEADLVRFPDDLSNVESVISFSGSRQDWGSVERIVLSQDFGHQSYFDWIVYTEALMNQKDLNRARSVLAEQIPAFDNMWEKLDFTARIAIDEAEVDRLKEAADTYIQLYPNFLDGYFYLAAYYHLVGEIEKEMDLRAQIQARLDR